MFGFPQSSARPGNEAFELLKAWAATSLAFAILLRGSFGLPLALMISIVTVALGIIGHELAHRYVARHFGSQAHFIANDGMLVLAILTAFLGFLFAAPGAVWHSGYITKRQSGLIAAAGPATNMVLAIVSLAILKFVPVGGTLVLFIYANFRINSWLGLFNMIPFGPIDGAKILNWNTVVFAVMAGLGLFLVFGAEQLILFP